MISEHKTNFRWVIVAILFLATTINYFDRFILGIMAPLLEKEIGWNEIQYGYIVSAFQMAYAAGTLVAGYFIDKIGTRWGFALAVGLWSIASMTHAAARSWIGFAIARSGLGLSEAGNFPASIKTIAEWFPRKERAFATGLFNGGASLGSVLAPVFIPFIIVSSGSWKWVFIVSGILGLIWIILWIVFYSLPGDNRFVNRSEAAYIEDDPSENDKVKISWWRLIQFRQTWAIALGKLFSDPVWYFYLFWGAKFLNSKFGIDLKEMALPLVSIYTVSYLGGILGGAVSSSLIAQGKSVNFSRKITLLGSALFVLPVMTVPYYSSQFFSVALIALAAAAHCSWSATIFTFASDLFPKNLVASVTGFATTISTLGGLLSAILIGSALNESSTNGYQLAFAVSSVFYLIGLIIIHILVPRMKPISTNKKI
jgi:ACS family hexuronate transporter-like MFS transporter